MAELLKYVYNQSFFDAITKAIKPVVPGFKKARFLKDVFDDQWDALELKERMRHVSVVLNSHLSEDYTTNVDLVLSIMNQLQSNGYKLDSLELMCFPDFIEYYGVDAYKVSIKAIEQITQFSTCEFAVRPFILKYPDKMLRQMQRWSKHKHPSVRRLATEGCRPRLPWAMGIPFLKKDPSPIIPILEKLKDDGSESVRRSVANNLNDISKDHPDLVIDLVRQWQGLSPEVDWVVRHASRTLLKQGNLEVMQLFGFGSIKNIDIHDFKITRPTVNIGGEMWFEFKLKNTSTKATKIRLEYGLYYQKANGTLSRKVFKISEKSYPGNSISAIKKKQSFKIITTRKLHVGLHQLAVIINGQELDKLDFTLTQ